MKNPEATWETITPQRALELLVNNNHNRTLSQRLINRIATDILDDKWQLNGSAIRLDPAGNILDGQHRLHAIERSGKPCRSLIITGLDAACMETIDTNCKSRTNADFLSMAGEKYSQTLSTALTWICRMELSTLSSRDHFAVSTLTAALEKHPDIRASVALVVSRRLKIMASSSASALHYLFSQKDPALALVFIEGLCGGFDPVKHPNFLLLYKRLINNLTSKLKTTHNELMLLSVKAWNVTRKGRTLGALRVEAGEGSMSIQ